MRIGYFLSCEEYSPDQLLKQTRLAAEAGFEGLWISDHYHPWTDEQGQSAFVWSMIGALAQVCDLPVTTAVTCPTVRIHPAVIAQAAATSAVLHQRAVHPDVGPRGHPGAAQGIGEGQGFRTEPRPARLGLLVGLG
jgi:G6PDH family F420-dependent oxidoreductase